MPTQSSTLTDRLTRTPTAKYVVFGLLGVVFIVAVGHLYLFSGLTTRYLGLPLWIWLQLVVVFLLLGVAWGTVNVITSVREGGA